MKRQDAYDHQKLIDCAQGKLFGPGNPQLPLPSMLMMDRIVHISKQGGKYSLGEVMAELDIKKDMWFFNCHFHGDPVMPGCLGLDALWQMLGFYLGWLGNEGRGRALGCDKVKFQGQILPNMHKVVYHLHIQKIMKLKTIIGVAYGEVRIDDNQVYTANGLKVGLFKKL